MMRVVMVTLVRWDDRGEEMNQEEADQDVAGEVSEEVDSRGEMMRSEKNDWQFLRRSELVDEQEWQQMSITCIAQWVNEWINWSVDLSLSHSINSSIVPCAANESV